MTQPQPEFFRAPILCCECNQEQPKHRHAIVCTECLQAYKERITDLQDNAKTLSGQVKQAEGKAGAYKQKADTLHWQLSQAQEQISAQGKENRNLRTKLEKLTNERDTLEARKRQLQHRLCDLHQTLTDDRAIISNLKDDRNALIRLLEREYGDIGGVFEALEEQKEREYEQ